MLLTDDGAESDSSASSGESIDPEDPMRDYLIAQRKEAKALKKVKKPKEKGKHKDETPEERKARKAKKKEKGKKAKKVKSAGVKGVENLLNSLGRGGIDISHPQNPEDRHRHRSPERSRRSRSTSPRRRSWSRSQRSPYGDDRPPRRSKYLDDDARRDRTPPRYSSSRYLDGDERDRTPGHSKYSDEEDGRSHGHHSRGRRSRD